MEAYDRNTKRYVDPSEYPSDEEGIEEPSLIEMDEEEDQRWVYRELSESECPGVEVSWKAILDRSGWRGGVRGEFKGTLLSQNVLVSEEVDGEEGQRWVERDPSELACPYVEECPG